MSTSSLSMITEAITNMRTALREVSCTFSDKLIMYVKEIDDEARRRIEQMEDEAMAKANEEANAEAIPFDVMLEKMEEFDRECRCITRQEAAMFWGEDAQIFSEKMAARQNEVARAMANESARQAMKRRKLLHAEGHFPDWAC